MGAEGLAQFRRDLHAYVAKLPREIGRAVVQESADNFRRQGYENEQGAVVPWAPRKNERGRRRNDGGRDRRFKHRALLIKSGRLRRSVRIVATTATSVTVGSSEPYAQPQQEGSGRGLTARPFITFGRSAQQKLTRQIAAKITGLLK